MTVFYLFLLACVIVIAWNLTGKYEWQLPVYLRERIASWKNDRKQAVPADTLVLNIEAREFMTDEMEKEIYIVRKSRNQNSDSLLMNVKVRSGIGGIGSTDIDKAKLRLEKRFPGLTINVTRQDMGG